MKIKDIITFNKENCNTSHSWYNNQFERDFEKKHGHYYSIPCHSKNTTILANNYDRDCIVAYVENKYFIFFLMKMRGKDNYKAFRYSKELLRELVNDYVIENIYSNKVVLNIFEEDKENLNMVDEEEYSRFKKLIILEAISD